MKKLLLITILVYIPVLSLKAQTELEKINEIKKSLNFVYAIGTSTVSIEEANANAKELLSLEINQWLQEIVKGDFSGYLAKAKNSVETINTRKGKLMRSFVYVRKTDILPYYNEETIMVVSKDSAVATLPMDSIKLGIPIRQASAERKDATNPKKSDLPLYVPLECEKEMIEISDLREINAYITRGIKNGKVTNYGKYDSSTQLFGKSYFFLIDKQGNVIARLCKNGSNVFNIATGESTTIGDFGKCGVIWFQIKE